MIALAAVQNTTCDGCGGHLPDTTASDADGAYVADMPIRCHRCTAIAIQADAYRDAPQSQALRFPVHRAKGR